MKSNSDFVVIILAAGKSVRMKSSIPKVLHLVAGQPMIVRTLNISDDVRPRQIIVVTSPQSNDLIQKIVGKRYNFAVQEQPLGTADAVNSGLRKVSMGINTVAVMYGDDTAFYKPKTILNVFKKHQESEAKITFVTVKRQNPAGLGRIIRKKDKLVGIVEEKDATASQRKIKEVNDGLYFFERNWLASNLSKLLPSKATGELYLTDLIQVALENQDLVETYKLENSNEWQPVNTQEELNSINKKFERIPRKIHIMGIAGAGASAIAGIAQARGFEVTGCDLNPDSSYVKNLNIKIEKAHSPSHLKSVDMLVVSPAVLKLDPKNKELQHARMQKIPVLTWQEFQGRYLQQDKFVITVAGAYGKSTTTAMISKILEDQDLSPTSEVGAKVLIWQKNFQVGNSKYYICEADEYNDNFLNYHPNLAVILNTAWDHPDYFKSKKQLLESYQKFIANIKRNGILIITDDPDLKRITKSARRDIKIIKITQYKGYNLSIIGDFRKENANAALTVAEILSLDIEVAKESITKFSGLGRRLEYKGKIGGVRFYDDYAVQPYTIQATINALKKEFKNKRMLLIFEPHTFSRINNFFADFAQSLSNCHAGHILVTQVYAAREEGNKTKLAKDLTLAIGHKATFTGSLESTARYLGQNLKNYGVVCTMGAGDIYKLHAILREKYAGLRTR